MINFIVCDDNKDVRQTVVNCIDSVMMKNKLAYKNHVFDDYNTEFMKLMKSKKSCKVYILDIETPSRSGIDIARMIRADDIDSVIIFLTSHEELAYLILKGEFMFLTFISKFDNYEQNMISAVKKSLEIIGHQLAIRFYDRGSLYTIPLKDILFITRDSVERKCIIKTNYTEFKVNKSLSEIMGMLDGRFKQSHRACIINTDRVVKINQRNKSILFDDNTTLYLLSDNYKKELIKK